MSRTDLDPTTTRALSALDPAPARPLTGDEAARAEDLLARIVAAPAVDDGPHPAPPTRRRTRRRLAVVGGLAAASAVGIVGVQLLTGGDTAYATWTAVPHRPTTPEQLAAADACRDSLRDTISDGGSDPSGVTPAGLDAARLVVAEQRGAWTMVVLGGPPGVEGSCLTRSGPLRAQSTTGYLGTGGTAPQGREIRLSAWGTSVNGDAAVTEVVGAAGPQVASVVLHSAQRGDVTATVRDGHLLAWWPVASDGGPVDDTLPEATVTYTDGSTWRGRLEATQGTPTG
ncbi:hypothetical protein [Phycicoccus avicenniae]|uniref:hypothetical protein n=1 Tax=Phycicoccus avicenniae TaxID=2828860 RepID=UPI003D29F559